MQVNPARLAIYHTRIGLSLLAAGQRKRAIRKLKQARRAIANLPSRRFQTASTQLSQALWYLKSFDNGQAQGMGRAAIFSLTGPMT